MKYFTQWIIVKLNSVDAPDDTLDAKIVHTIKTESFVEAEKLYNAWIFEHGEFGAVYRLFGNVEEQYATYSRPPVPAGPAARKERESYRGTSSDSETYTPPYVRNDDMDIWPSPAPAPVEGGGGSFDGAGASGNWDTPAPSPSYDSSSSDSGYSSSDSGSSSGGGD